MVFNVKSRGAKPGPLVRCGSGVAAASCPASGRPWRRWATAACLWGAAAAAQAWTVVVTDAGDALTPCATTGVAPCTLRDAVTYANAHRAEGGDNRIEFNIGGGEHTIVVENLLSPLPSILPPAAPATSLTLDAGTQPGHADFTPPRPLITLKPRIARSGSGLEIGGRTTVRGLAIGQFAVGIAVSGDGNAVLGNHIGVDAAGTAAMGNGANVIVTGGSGNRIGGLGAGERNLLSAATATAGVHFEDGGGTAAGNIVQGNHVGTDITGTQDLGNATHGISVGRGYGGTLIDGNLVSANRRNGISIHGNGSIVTRNRVGTDAAGRAALGNARHGIALYFSARGGNRIGTDSSDGNLVAGNALEGIVVEGHAEARNPGTRIVGNTVGTNVDASAALPNRRGIMLIDTDGAVIAGNTVGGNVHAGIQLHGDSAHNRIQGNLVGTNARGDALPNRDGVVLYLRAHDNRIGGERAGLANTISRNRFFGVALLSDEIHGIAVLGNRIYRNGVGGIGSVGIANRAQAAPVLSGAIVGAVTGVLDSAAHEDFRIEYFFTPRLPNGKVDADAGKTLLGFERVTTDSSGHAELSFRGRVPHSRAGTVTATATRLATGDTSQFSRWIVRKKRPATARPQGVEVPRGVAQEIVLTGEDPDGDALSFAIVQAPEHGELGELDSATGQVTYTPAPGYTGRDAFRFTVSDGQVVSEAATVDITVQANPGPGPGPGPSPNPGSGAKAVPGLGGTGAVLLVLSMAGLGMRRLRRRS